MTSTKNRIASCILFGTFGGLALVGLLDNAMAETAKESPVQTMSLQDAKAKLPLEWRWERPTINLNGMIRTRG